MDMLKLRTRVLILMVAFLLAALIQSFCGLSIPETYRRRGDVWRHRLQFSDSSFKVAIIADLHYGENGWTDWGPAQDEKSTGVQEYILDTEQPDFVIYLGDLVSANNVAAANATAYWSMALAPAVKRGIPFATVFGNHDDMYMEFEENWFGPSGCPLSTPDGVGYYKPTTRQQLLEAEFPTLESLTQAGPKSLWPSLSNYVLKVFGFKDPQTVSALFYVLDSGGGSYPEVVSANQAAWFTSTAEALNPNGSIAEFVFFHIPTKAHSEVAIRPGDPIQSPCVGGINSEEVASQIADWGLISALTARPSVKATFSGHNHGLDWCCPHKSLWLCFSRHSGYGGYGNWTRGSRIIELTETSSVSIKSWIRLETGSVIADTELGDID